MINKKQQLYNKAKKYQRETVWTSFRNFREAEDPSEYWKYFTHIIDPEQDKDKNKKLFGTT